MSEINNKLDFRPITLKDKKLYEKFISGESERGCEYSFANLYLWGNQNYTIKDDCMIFLSQFDEIYLYGYPIGCKDKKAAINSIIADSYEREIPCIIAGLTSAEKQFVSETFPGKFIMQCDDGTFDYVYHIDDLADLKGKHYHGKRNHFYRFRDEFPDYKTEPLNAKNADDVRNMIACWYDKKFKEDQESEEHKKRDYHLEQQAIKKALDDFRELDMEGLVIQNGGNVIAVTLGSRLSENTFDVHFEKAYADINGAYAAINCEFARYIREKYHDIEFLNREEDMGIEGLRKAKQSYHPHHMTEKYRAVLIRS